MTLEAKANKRLRKKLKGYSGSERAFSLFFFLAHKATILQAVKNVTKCIV